MSDSILAQLNDEQRQAVTKTDGALMIIAGAGTGKTKVITSRIAYIIANARAKPNEILALTFTDKASEEMKMRLDRDLPYGKNDLDVYTFHSFGDILLKENAISLGLTPDYRLLSRAEEVYFFREHLFDFSLQYYRPISNPTRFIEILLGYFSKLKDEDISASDYARYAKMLKRSLQTAGDPNNEISQEEITIHTEIATVLNEYEEMKMKEGVVSFADLIAHTLFLLRTKPTISSYYQNKYKYILVDEYQDTNYSQNEIVKILSKKHHNLCVCGDDDQSIYKFRGASISNILHFQEEFPDCTKVVLTKNYRSTQEILDSAYKLITFNNPDRLEIAAHINKKLTAAASHLSIPVFSHMFDTVDEQFAFVTKTIKELREANADLALSDMAILIRSNSQAQQIIRECNIADIPFTYAGNTGLYETLEIRPLIAFLFALARFDDNMSFFLLAQSPLYNLSMHALIACNNLARIKNKPLSVIFRSTDEYGEEISLDEHDREIIRSIVTDIDHYQELSRDENVGSLLLSYIKDKGYFELFESNSVAVENIQRFFQRIDRFISNTNATSVPEFCNYIDYTREMGDDPGASEADPTFDGVHILTIHKAKGMEFRVVFMVDLVEGRFPTRAMKDPIEIPAELVKEILPKGDFHKEEERRLFYVGMTRAKEYLYLLGAKDYYQKTLKKASPFVLEAMGQEQVKEKRQRAPEREVEKGEGEPHLNESHLIISQSQIEDYLTCPRKFDYAYSVKLASVSNFNSFYGSLMHMITQEILKRYMKGETTSKEVAIAMLDEEWREEGFLSDKHRSAAYTLAKDSLTLFLENLPLVEPKFIEKEFSVPFDKRTTITGRFDLIEKNGSIIDLKTTNMTNQKDADTKAKESIQLKIYCWAYEKVFGHLPIDASLLFLGSNLRGTIIPTKKTLAEAEKLIVQVVEGIRRKDFAANPSFLACTYCQYNKICEFTLAN